jgi:hypothetical protein
LNQTRFYGDIAKQWEITAASSVRSFWPVNPRFSLALSGFRNSPKSRYCVLSTVVACRVLSHHQFKARGKSASGLGHPADRKTAGKFGVDGH